VSSARIFWAFQEFCAAVVREAGHPPYSVFLPDVAFDGLQKELGERAVWETSPRDTPTISYETGHGVTLIRRVSVMPRSAPPSGGGGSDG
jgi:hypothetical protein